MATEIKAPTFPESVQEGSLATWHKKVGDTVARDELLVDIETDKVVLEVVAPVAGVLLPPTPSPRPAPFICLAAGFALGGWGDPSPTCFASSSCHVVVLGV